jgi:hypothetical protein
MHEHSWKGQDGEEDLLSYQDRPHLRWQCPQLIQNNVKEIDEPKSLNWVKRIFVSLQLTQNPTCKKLLCFWSLWSTLTQVWTGDTVLYQLSPAWCMQMGSNFDTATNWLTGVLLVCPDRNHRKPRRTSRADGPGPLCAQDVGTRLQPQAITALNAEG